MSKPSCDACTELREYAPEFVMSGVTERVATSLKNNTGLNPSLAAIHDNCEDLQDVVDCLIGRLGQELEAHDVCDWKDFMSRLTPNLYETLKAMIMDSCGQWTLMCEHFRLLLGAIGGSGAKAHAFTPSQFWTTNARAWWHNGTSTPDDISQYFKPSFESEIRTGTGCANARSLLAWRPATNLFDVPFSNYPYLYGFSIQNLTPGEVLGWLPKSKVVPHDMPENRWKDLLRGGSAYYPFSINITDRVFVRLRGYTTIDGVVMNEDLAEYGEDTMVMSVAAVDRGSTGGELYSGLLGTLKLGLII